MSYEASLLRCVCWVVALKEVHHRAVCTVKRHCHGDGKNTVLLFS